MRSRCSSSWIFQLSVRCWFVLLLTVPADGQSTSPRLTVLVVAEQFRADYLDSYGADFSDRGIGRLVEGGTVVKRSRFDYLTTLSAPGSATLATGAWPNAHGIIANSWYDPGLGAIVDAAGPAENPGPSALVGSTVADQLMLAAAGRSKVLAVSGSSAPGILLAGRKPTGCYWLGQGGQFRTSAYYSKALPGWVRKFNEEQPLVGSGPHRVWRAFTAEPSSPPLRILQGEAFPNLYRASPFAVETTFDFARSAVVNERLGERDYPDLLIINLSAPALLALETGAHSPLMRDMILRIDQSLALFLDWLDTQVDDVAIAFTGAHGTPPQAADLMGAGLRLRRVSGESIVQKVTAALEGEPSPRFFVQKYVYPFLYLGGSTPLATEGDRRRAAQIAARAAESVPGVERAYFGKDSMARLERSMFVGRSGDVALAYEPFTVEAYGANRGVASGSYQRYDTDVPLIFYGARFRQMTIERDVPATVVAPTLAALLGVSMPSGAGESPLAEALIPVQPAVPGPPDPGGAVE